MNQLEPQRWRLTRWFILACVALLLAACGEHSLYAERYQVDFEDPRTTFEYKEDNFYVRLWIDDYQVPVESQVFSVWRDSEAHITGPYGLGINANWYGRTEDTVGVLEIIMEREGEPPIILHGRDDPPMELEFEPWLDHAISSDAVVPLDELLPFEEARKVSFTVTLRPPEGLDEVTVTTVFKGTAYRRDTLKIETVLLGG